MKIKLDENLPRRLATMLQALGHDVDTVQAEGLAGHADETVVAAAQRHHRLFITQDVGVGDIRTMDPRYGLGVILLRLRDPGRNRIVDRVCEDFERHSVEAWTHCVVVGHGAKNQGA